MKAAKPHADGHVTVDAVKVEWDEGKKLEEDAFHKREPEATFSFPV